MTIKTPSAAAVLPLDELPTYECGCRVRTTSLVTRAVGTTSFITGYTDFDAGTQIAFLNHNREESVALIAGDALLDIDGLDYCLKSFLDCSYIPPNVPYCFRNLSETLPMKISWLCARADANRVLMEADATTPVSAEHHT